MTFFYQSMHNSGLLAHEFVDLSNSLSIIHDSRQISRQAINIRKYQEQKQRSSTQQCTIITVLIYPIKLNCQWVINRYTGFPKTPELLICYTSSTVHYQKRILIEVRQERLMNGLYLPTDSCWMYRTSICKSDVPVSERLTHNENTLRKL